VTNVCLELLSDLDAYDRFVAVKSPNATTVDAIEANGWNVLSEGIPYLVQVGLEGSIFGITPALVNPVAARTYMMVMDGAAPVRLNQGPATTLADPRLGLRVVLAFVWGLWRALRRIGTCDDLTTLFGGPPNGSDLATTAAFLATPRANQAFRRLVWGPLRAVRDATVGNNRWVDLDGRIRAPTTHDFFQYFQQQFVAGLTPADAKIVRDLYGDVDAPDPVDGSPNGEQVSYHLWFDWV
jgi:hypothetical protein